MILLDSKHIDRTLRRMAYQIVEEAHGAPVHMIGLNERGFSISKIMQPIIEKETGHDTPLEQLDIQSEETFNFSTKPKPSSVLVIIDDVIFSGRTFQAAIDKISERNEFQKVFIAVLVDRGHRKFPIHAAVVGTNTPTKFNEQVNLELINSIPHQVILEKI